jgi:hypothetical protein
LQQVFPEIFRNSKGNPDSNDFAQKKVNLGRKKRDEEKK